MEIRQFFSLGQVIFAVRHDWAARAEDIIARRTRLAFLDKEAAIQVIPRGDCQLQCYLIVFLYFPSLYSYKIILVIIL